MSDDDDAEDSLSIESGKRSSISSNSPARFSLNNLKKEQPIEYPVFALAQSIKQEEKTSKIDKRNENLIDQNRYKAQINEALVIQGVFDNLMQQMKKEIDSTQQQLLIDVGDILDISSQQLKVSHNLKPLVINKESSHEYST